MKNTFLKSHIIELIILMISLVLYGMSIGIDNGSAGLFRLSSVVLAFISFIMFVIPKRSNAAVEALKKKDNLLNEVLTSNFENYKYILKNGISAEEIIKADIFMGNYTECGETLISTYKEYPFSLSIMNNAQSSGAASPFNSGHYQHMPLFEGIFISIKKDFDLKGNIKFGQTTYFNSKTNYKIVKLDNDLFNKKFSVVSEDEEDVLKFLTKEQVEKILKLSENNKGYFSFTYIDKTLYITLKDKVERFTYDIERQDDVNKKEFEKQINQVKEILDVFI